jgi:hypothetical protein
MSITPFLSGHQFDRESRCVLRRCTRNGLHRSADWRLRIVIGTNKPTQRCYSGASLKSAPRRLTRGTLGAPGAPPGPFHVSASPSYSSASCCRVPPVRLRHTVPSDQSLLTSGPLWLHEIEHDGFRVVARNSNRMRL